MFVSALQRYSTIPQSLRANPPAHLDRFISDTLFWGTLVSALQRYSANARALQPNILAHWDPVISDLRCSLQELFISIL